MSSLKKRVTTYLRQLSFHNESCFKDDEHLDLKSFVVQTLKRDLNDYHRKKQALVISKRTINELPIIQISQYEQGDKNVIGSCTGPERGLLTYRAKENNSQRDTIDFIDKDDECTIRDRIDLELPFDWESGHHHTVYGRSDSLYDFNLIDKKRNGEPVADCYGAITRSDSAILIVADGVNWGERSSVASKSAVYAATKHINKVIFDTVNPVRNSNEVFQCLFQALNQAHLAILRNNGTLTTLTVLVMLPIQTYEAKKFLRSTSINFSTTRNGVYINDFTKKLYLCCVCNVGDSLAYVYSPTTGFREITEGSHNLLLDRDIRDALGALGPADGSNPNLSNLTFSMTIVQSDDLLLLCTDGLSDNFDPSICRLTSSIPAHDTACNNVTNQKQVMYKRAMSTQEPHTSTVISKNVLLRSKTQSEILTLRTKIPRDVNGLLIVPPQQRHYLAMCLMEHVLHWDKSQRKNVTLTAKDVCNKLIEFTFHQTAEKRKAYEDGHLYYDTSPNGLRTELSLKERRLRRQKLHLRVQHLPGKLDHVTALAFNVP